MMYWGLAAAYQDQGNPFHAKINYQKALSFLEETENAGLLALIRALLGQALMNVGDHEEAEQYLRKSLAGARAEKYVIALKLALSNMAAFHNAQSEPDQALPLAAEALQIALESEDRQFEVQLSLILATSYTIKNNLPQAEQVITRAIQVAQQISVPKLLRQGHEHLAEFFRVQGRLEEAFNRMLLANASLGAAN
jgi:tetratricopeptide (TPR) repeat protein